MRLAKRLCRFLLVYITGFSTISISAQSAKIDSLNRLLAAAKADTTGINLLNEKISAFIEVNLDSALAIALLAINKARQANYEKGEAEAKRLFAVVSCFKGNYKEAEASLVTAEKMYTQIKDNKGLAKVYSVYGMLYGMQSKYDSSIRYYKRCIKIAEDEHDEKILTNAYQNIAISYQMQSDFSQSIFYFQKALRLAEAKNDATHQGYIWMNMGLTYSNMNDTLRAEAALKKAIVFARKAGTSNIEVYAYSNLAGLYYKKGDDRLSYDYAMQAARLGRVTGDQGIVAASLSKASGALLRMNRPAEALTLSLEAVSVADSSKQPYNIYQAHNAAGEIFMQEGKYPAAISYYEKGFEAIKEADIYDETTGKNYSNLSECYEKVGEYSKALAAYKISARIIDSVRNIENIRKATEMNMNYEFDKKQQAQAQEKQKQDLANKMKQTWLIAGLSLFIILSGVALMAYKNKQKANALLKEQKTEIETTLAELKITQKQLIHSEKMASLGELTAGIAHEIQNPLNFVNNFSEINDELITELQTAVQTSNTEEAMAITADIKDNCQKITHHGKRADSIVKGMLLHSRTSTGHKEAADINALADEYMRLSYHGLRAKDKTFNAVMETSYDGTIGNIPVVPQDIGRVLLNLFNNAFYAVADRKKIEGENYHPKVSVVTRKIPGNIEITVGDNGRGIPDAITEKIFQPFFTTKPTGQGTGLGLSLSYDIITKEHNGTIRAETKEGQGSTFIVTLPV